MILVVGMVGWPTTPAQAVGLITHKNVLKRAEAILEGRGGYQPLSVLLDNYSWQVTYGAMFPDYGYALKNDPVTFWSNDDKWEGYSETAHTPKFMKDYLDYVKPSFGSSDPEDRKAIAFLFGMIAHNVADERFHKGPNNFIDAAKLNDSAIATTALSCMGGALSDGGTNHACTEL